MLVDQPPDRPRFAAPGDQLAGEPQRLIRIRRARDLSEQRGPDARGPLARGGRQRGAIVAAGAGELGARCGDIDEPEP